MAGRFLAPAASRVLRHQFISRNITRNFSNRAPLSSHFQPLAIDAKWQKQWSKAPTSTSSTNPSKYVLAMFPYPSGELHMGHVRVYTITDVLARWYRLQGEQVVHPMGWDSFGLPAENAALQRGIHPEEWTIQNVSRMRAQLQSLGLSLDWDREFMTSDPSYYRWTQWIFLQLHELGLVQQKSAFVNWDPVDKTVLANEQVDSQGRSWRSGALVERRSLKQWFVNVRDSAPDLLKGLDSLEKWPESVKAMQKNWIGKSRGHVIEFRLDDDLPTELGPVTVFTTRLETLLGVSYVALAPGHSLLKKLIPLIPESRRAEVQAYCTKVSTVKTRHSSGDHETTSGVSTGLSVVHPITRKKVPVFVADYVLEGAGTGAVMGVPAHDERDALFAAAKSLPVINVLEDPKSPETPQFDYSPGLRIINSGDLDGMTVKDARKELGRILHETQTGSTHTSYRLQDWLVSRQRFWGTPVPIIHCQSCGPVPVPEDQLPVELPKLDNIFKNGGAEPVLASDLPEVVEWRSVVCPSCGADARRDVDTLDTFVCSSWYYLRYLSPGYAEGPVDPGVSKSSMPVDVYVGGIEHATSHLLYARFINRFLNKHLELLSQGMVQSATYRHPVSGLCVPSERIRSETLEQGTEQFFDTEDGENHSLSVSYEKMSKSKFNGVHPQDVLDVYGADTTRLFTVFAAPPSQPLQWDPRAITGVARWLQRVWSLLHSHSVACVTNKESASDEEPSLAEKRLWSGITDSVLNVSKHLENRDLNLVVSDMMTFTNRVADLLKTNPELNHSWSMHAVLRQFLVTLAPLAPHVTEELWAGLRASIQSGNLAGWKPPHFPEVFPDGGVHEQAWPVADPSLILVESIPVVLQVNGSVKGQVDADPACLHSDEELRKVMENTDLYQQLVVQPVSEGAEIKRVICIRQSKRNMGLVNIVLALPR